MSTEVRWFPDSFIAAMEGKLGRNLDIAAEFLKSDIQTNFPGGGPKGTRTGGAKGRHSRPGGIPFVQTGTLKRSIRWDRKNEFVRRIGSTLKPQDGYPSYPKQLEFGEKRMKPRPWLRPALARNERRLFEIITR